MKQSVVYIGIDVAKAHLDVAWAGTFRRLPNERSGHAALVRWIGSISIPKQNAEKPRALAAWVSERDVDPPIQATGGWLNSPAR